MARISGRHDAVEEVHAACDGFNDVRRRADAHQIARPVFWHIRLDRLNDLIHDLSRFADGQTADGVARQVELGDLLHVPDAQILERRALIDPPELLTGIDSVRLSVISGKRLLAPGKPARRALAGRLGILVFCGVFHALVKRHGNIGAEIRLDAHTLLRSHEDPVAVKMGRERHALLLDLSESGQGKDLKSAGIRQDRAVPRHEFVQAAHIAHDLVSGPQMQMIGVGQLDLRADRFQISSRQRALDRSLRADVHKNRRLNRPMRAEKLPSAGSTLCF